jgi:uncharacterized BrkB/YihY/UPF0761 family membrane protein
MPRMLTTGIASDPSPRTWMRHVAVLGVLGVLVAALSLLVWFHPTAGYVSGGVLDGADLRGSLIQILGWTFAAFAAVSTIIFALLPTAMRAAPRYALAYAAGAAAIAIALPLLDKVY